MSTMQDNRTAATRHESQRTVICGCAVMNLDHKPGEPTDYDRAYNAVKRLFASLRRDETAVEYSPSPKKAHAHA